MAFRKLEDVLGAREKKTPGIRTTILKMLEGLEEFSAGRQAVRNLRDEELVHETVWKKLIDELLLCTGMPNAIHDTVRDVMRSDSLGGRAAKCHPTTVFGRATSVHDLARAFYDNGRHGSLKAAKRNVRKNKRVPAAELRVLWRAHDLGYKVMWATFNPSGAPPFTGIGTRANQIRAVLGLPRVGRKRIPLLLLQYTLLNRGARMPRVTEAYAGDSWTHFFRPAGLTERDRGYGRTFPWDEIAQQPNGDGVPEIVHKPITGAHLATDVVEVQ